MFKVGEEIICLNKTKKKTDKYLTIGKTYIINNILISPRKCQRLLIINDDDQFDFYDEQKFTSLIQYRKLKINKIKNKICVR